MLIFESKTNTKQNLKLSFKVLAYQYRTSEFALQKFNELEKVKRTHDESVFGKSYNYVFVDGSCIFRLDAGCTYSGSEWEKLKRKFGKAKHLAFGRQVARNIECICGGMCK